MRKLNSDSRKWKNSERLISGSFKTMKASLSIIQRQKLTKSSLLRITKNFKKLERFIYSKLKT